jgi:phosphoglycerate dehydrogenase-like enzyme
MAPGRAGLGVFDAEPVKPGHPLARPDNATLSPHAAFCTWKPPRTCCVRA